MGGVGDIMMVMLVLAGAYIVIKSGKLEEILGGNFQLPDLPGLPAPTPAPTPSGEDEAPAGGPSGPISQGGSCPGGESCQQDGQGRYDCDAAKPDAYEATWCGTFSGDDLSVKLWGPKHSGSSCCWCILSVSPDGAFGMRHEGPHPSTSGKSGTTPAIGKPDCIKAVIKPGPGGAMVEGYGLVGGQWKKALTYTGPCGYNKKSTKKTGDQVTFRVDGSMQTKCATVKPLGGGGGGAAPAPAEGGGEDEEAGAGAVRVGSRCGRNRIRYDHEYDSILSRL